VTAALRSAGREIAPPQLAAWLSKLESGGHGRAGTCGLVVEGHLQLHELLDLFSYCAARSATGRAVSAATLPLAGPDDVGVAHESYRQMARDSASGGSGVGGEAASRLDLVGGGDSTAAVVPGSECEQRGAERELCQAIRSGIRASQSTVKTSKVRFVPADRLSAGRRGVEIESRLRAQGLVRPPPARGA